MRIGVDLDNVLNNLIYEWINIYNERNNDKLTINDIKTWDIHKYAKNGKGVYDYLTDDLFERLIPLPGAIYTTLELKKHHELFVITASYPKNLEIKMRWLEVNFPHISYNDVVITQRKDLVNVDVLIDDAPHNIINFPGKVIVMDYPWNRGISKDHHRVKGWEEIYNFFFPTDN